jgi:protein-L-isoaspartate O-methyltransferase
MRTRTSLKAAVAVVAVTIFSGCPAAGPPSDMDTSKPAAPASTGPTAATANGTATAGSEATAAAPTAVATAAPASSPPAPGSTAIGPAERVPDIEYVPTPNNVVDKMLEVAKVGKDDVLYDLGCGDGRIVVAAAKRFGIRTVGFDIDPVRVKEARANVKKNNVGHLVAIEQKDVFTVDLSPATVVTLYLLPELNVKLIPQLEKLRPGARVVSHDFDMAGVEPDNTWTVIAKDHRTPKNREHFVYLWTVPLKKTKAK